MTDQTAKPTVDWERIETDYRAGILSLREIAAANPGSNHVAIKRRADREGWTKDLSSKIAAEAERVVTRKAVTDGRVVTDKVVVEVNASAVAQVRLQHREDINRYRNLATGMLAKLEGEMSAEKPPAIGTCITNLKAASDTLKVLIALEREAWGLVDVNKAGGGVGATDHSIEVSFV